MDNSILNQNWIIMFHYWIEQLLLLLQHDHNNIINVLLRCAHHNNIQELNYNDEILFMSSLLTLILFSTNNIHYTNQIIWLYIIIILYGK